ncbi:hypothetical protein QUW35_00310 [Ligilactobacillus agilis]|uniref:hypothetical protein n=1 Tax=Ligilactobacillus agilis TaxID=1601 RepID=UPI0025A3BA33|nr:hypothetical protein [Ligilactobacillus agilis]MDM8279138.1 hypothetical protein [Ligilactobacillus agilis]
MNYGVGEAFRNIAIGVIFLIMLSVGVMVYQINTLSSYNSEVASLIQTNGGVTTAVTSVANGHGSLGAAYHHIFSVHPKTPADGQKHDFGQRINYYIEVRVPVLLGNKLILKTVSDTTVSKAAFNNK